MSNLGAAAIGVATKAVGPRQGFFVAQAPNEAAIRAAANAAIAAGGGVVVIPAGVIQLTQPLPVGPGVSYEGEIVPSWVELSTSLATGTVLVGDGVVGVSPGTFNAFEWNTADNANVPYADGATMFAASVRGFGLRNLVLRSFKYGVKFGGLHNVGIHSLYMDRVIAEHCDWGFWTENCMEPHFGYVAYSVCKSGGFYHGSSMDTLWHFGNGIMEHVIGQNGGGMSTAYTPGIVIEARGTNSELNDITVLNLQANGVNGTTYTQASAPVIVSGSPDILVTSNISKFQVDSLVSFGSAIGGLDPNVMYWIVSRTDNGDGTGSFRLGVMRRAVTVVTPAASGSSAITLYPSAQIVIGGQGSTGAANSVTFSQFPLIDCEASSGVGIALQQLNGCSVQTSIISGGTGLVALAIFSSGQRNNVYMRSPVSMFYCNVQYWQFSGYLPTAYFGGSNATAWRHHGLLTDQPNSVSRIFLTDDRRTIENMTGGVGDITVASPTVFPAVAFGRPTQKFHGRLASGSTITFRSGGLITYSGAGGGNFTLPIITATMVGLELEVMNPSSGTLTLNTQSSQTVNGVSATTSYVAAANTLTTLRACTADGTTFFWAAK